MRAFTPRPDSFFTRRSASARVLYAASWMVQTPRGGLAFGAVAFSERRAGSSLARGGDGASARDGEADGIDEVLSVRVGAGEALVVVLVVLVLVVLTRVVVVADAADCVGAERGAPAVVTFAVGDDAVPVAVAQ